MNMSDIMDWLDKIPLWKTLKSIPDRVSNLESKISELEEKLSLEPPPTCPYCFKGEQHMEARFSFPVAEPPHEVINWKCQNPDCGKSDQRTVIFKK